MVERTWSGRDEVKKKSLVEVKWSSGNEMIGWKWIGCW